MRQPKHRRWMFHSDDNEARIELQINFNSMHLLLFLYFKQDFTTQDRCISP